MKQTALIKSDGLPMLEQVTTHRHDTRYAKAPRRLKHSEQEYVATTLALNDGTAIIVYTHANDACQLGKCSSMDDAMFTLSLTYALSNAYEEIRRITPNSDGTAEVEGDGPGFRHTTTTGEVMYFWISNNTHPPEKNWRERPRCFNGQSLF